MATTGKLGRFAWCWWSEWIKECYDEPEKIINIGPGMWPSGMDMAYFRQTAGHRATESTLDPVRTCRAHVHFSRAVGLIRLQFCWEVMTEHVGLHLDGKKLYKSDFNRMDREPWETWKPPSTRQERMI